jgi:hypothetical protein
MSSLFCIVWAGGGGVAGRALDIFTVCPDVDLLCRLCIYSNIFVLLDARNL